jgi:hypothetical protein
VACFRFLDFFFGGFSSVVDCFSFFFFLQFFWLFDFHNKFHVLQISVPIRAKLFDQATRKAPKVTRSKETQVRDKFRFEVVSPRVLKNTLAGTPRLAHRVSHFSQVCCCRICSNVRAAKVETH